jgi:hypothetical protein
VTLTSIEVVEIVKTRLWPLLRAERERVAKIDRWMRWDHDAPHKPRHATREYTDLATRAQAPWGRRVVSAVTDQLYVEGYRAANSKDDSTPWAWWQQNGMDARQIAIHESVVGYGLAHAVVLPGKSWLGDAMPVIRGLDPSQMIAVYEDPAWDDWPEYALRAEVVKVGDTTGWKLRLYDDTSVYHLVMSGSGDSLVHTDTKAHDVGVCPVVRYTNHLDLRGRASGDIEPIIPVLGRIDQTTFDRLVVQRFASWKVRTIAGMALDETTAATGETPQQAKLRLKVEDILVASDADTKFGTLDETSLQGFIEAHDADVRVLAAVSQSPAHELIGQMSNMSAEALAAAEGSLSRRVTRVKHPVGEAHEKTLRLSGKIMGNEEAAKDFSSQIVWRDMESRSLAQAADALGKLATMLGVPVEMLWEKVPGWTQQDVERAKALADQGGGIDALIKQLQDSAASAPTA